MNAQTAVAEIDRRLEGDRQSLLLLSQVDLAWEYFKQFRRQPDFSLGNEALADQIIADRRLGAMGKPR